MHPFRVGFGYDVHAFGPGDNLILGGISIEAPFAAIGHSDADVLIHAICDALFGTVNLRDIGYNFPDNDNAYKGIDSKILLSRTVEKIRQKGYEISNIDATVCLQQPKINPYILEMQKVLADVMGIAEDCVSLKATTSEKLGFVGREEGISAFAVALVYKIS